MGSLLDYLAFEIITKMVDLLSWGQQITRVLHGLVPLINMQKLHF